LFTLAGLGGPIVGWWLSGPVMAVCALIAAWGFWPLLKDAPPIRVSWPSVRIPLHLAARRAYEAAETAGVLHLTTPQDASPEAKLNHFKLLFMVDDQTELFGAKPPSTQSLPIPKAELQGMDIYPADGENSQLNHVIGQDRVAYTNVTVRRKDLRRVIEGYIAEARRIGR
jgi:hypothetical protein